MKAKTKIDKEAVNLSKQLKSLNNKQLSYVRKKIVSRFYIISRNRVFCTYCGHKDIKENYKLVAMIEKKPVIKCPNCKSTLDPLDYTYIVYKYFVTQIFMIKEFQVIQNFEITEIHRKGKPINISWQNVNAFFILPNGKWTVISKLIDNYSGNVRNTTSLEPRNKKVSNLYLKYCTAHVFNNGLHPILKRNGLDIAQFNASKLQRFNLLVLNLFNNNKVEYLLKAKQWALLNEYLKNNIHITKYWSQIKICIRHQYEIEDINLWNDYLENLEYFNKDLRSPHYICPDNLKAAHDRYMKKRRAAEKAKNLADQIASMTADNKKYNERLGGLLTLKFENNKVVVEPIKTVYDFRKLSNDINICIFENQYYKKNDLLLLTATDKKTNEIEVLSMNLYDATIQEIRGHSNKESNLRAIVNNLITKNRKTIKSLII